MGILVCPKRSQSEIRAPRYDDNDAVVLSLPPIHNQDTRICIVRLGLRDSQKAGLNLKGTSEMGWEKSNLPSELHFQHLPETLPAPVSAIQGEMVGDQMLQGPEKTNEEALVPKIPVHLQL